jgi:hypothetical protein
MCLSLQVPGKNLYICNNSKSENVPFSNEQVLALIKSAIKEAGITHFMGCNLNRFDSFDKELISIQLEVLHC